MVSAVQYKPLYQPAAYPFAPSSTHKHKHTALHAYLNKIYYEFRSPLELDLVAIPKVATVAPAFAVLYCCTVRRHHWLIRAALLSPDALTTPRDLCRGLPHIQGARVVAFSSGEVKVRVKVKSESEK